ncbi:SDR family NAD(P)-dependent oxidoreductase [Domibacillus aminovorans]|uniref:Short-chain dehydrogenase n=1 Tax=Domibacillus aminovorans TaxID=29332 RepID=A0A177L445_9BACI|nr:SDR family NAD(P)-dependent oxidoreductase [Domibacillus aminovorans]OAH60323.1 short-chain dehydrogenase [Domibacillus aminovorans]
MKTIAIIGAGPGLGLSLAKKFGSKDFNVALISLHESTLVPLVIELKALNINSKYYVSDVRDLEKLGSTLKQVQSDFGTIDVVEFSPYAGPQTFRHALEMNIDDVEEQYKMQVLPAIKLVQTVLPSMKEKGSGAILFNSGISALHPIPELGNTGIVCSGLRNYALNLHNLLKEEGIYVGFLAVATLIKKGTEGDPDLIAETWYDLYDKQDQFETVYPKMN